MPIGALVVTLAEDEAAAAAPLRELQADPRFTLGPREGRRVAVVAEAGDAAAGEAAWDWLRALPGVAFVDLVLVHFAQEASA